MVAFKRYNQMSSRLVMSLSFCTFVEACGNLMSLGVYERELQVPSACVAQGWLLQFSQNDIFAWMTVIAVNLYIVVCKHTPTYNYEAIYHLAVWSWALFVGFIPFASQAYGVAGVWCWIARNAQGYRWGTFYIPLFLQIVAVIVIYILIIESVRKVVFVRNQQGGATEESIKSANRLMVRLRAYPILFLLSYFFPIINRIYDSFSSVDSYFLYVMQSITAPVLGFVVAIAYGLDEEMQREWKSIFERLGFCTSVVVVNPTTNNVGDEISSSSEDVLEFGELSADQTG